MCAGRVQVVTATAWWLLAWQPHIWSGRSSTERHPSDRACSWCCYETPCVSRSWPSPDACNTQLRIVTQRGPTSSALHEPDPTNLAATYHDTVWPARTLTS